MEIDAKVVVTFYISEAQKMIVYSTECICETRYASNSYSRQYGLGYIGDVITITRLENKELKTETWVTQIQRKY